MNINRDYLIVNDVKKSNVKLDNGSIFFYITDKNTQNIFVNLVINVSNNDLIQKYANIENAEDYTLTMNIVKPDNTYKIIEGKLHDKENAIFEFDLNEDCCDEIGTYRCELLTKCNINDHEEITTSNKLTYKVKSSILNDLDDIVEAPEYPLVIQLFDKLSDIEQYEEDRRANELARQLAEEQRQTRFDTLDADMVDSIQAIDNKVVEVENRITAKEQAVDTLIANTKADIDDYKVAKDQEIDEYKAAKDTEINNAITAQDNKIDEAIANQNDRIAAVENNDVAQDNRLDIIENKNTQQDNRLNVVEAKNVEQDNRLNEIEAIDVAQNSRLDAIEVKNQQQDDRLLDIEKVNKRQDMNLKCLFAESKNNMIDITEEGNSIYLQNSTTGYTLIDEIKGNTLVNCNKEPDKELILNGNINTQGYSNVTLTEGVDGGLVDVALEGNTMVNVCNQKDPVAITKSYTVETGNHVALQGEYDGKCRPVVTGNTLWIDNDTGNVLTAFDESKNLRLQSSFEDKVVTQEMVDTGEEEAENLGKYKVDYVISQEDGTVGFTKTFYLNSPLLKGDTIEQQGDNVVHVHRYGKVVLDGSSDEDWAKANTDEGYSRFYSGTTLTADKAFQALVISDKLPTSTKNYLYGDLFNCIGGNSGNNRINIKLTGDLTVEEFCSYLQSNPVTVVYQLATPTYEVISQNDTILCDSYVNGHLDVDSVVPIEKVVFKRTPYIYLRYSYPSTKYIIQFEADNNGHLKELYTNGVQVLNAQVTKGINKFTGTTGANNWATLDIDGIGFNASNIVVTEATDQDFGYFEGMKSVGECENLEVVSGNSDGTLSNTQTLAHEPLRAVGDIKDKYVLIDGKWYIERNCAEVVLDGANNVPSYVDTSGLTNTLKACFSKVKGKSYGECICEAYPYMTETNVDIEHIRLDGSTPQGSLLLWINRNKLTSLNVSGINKYLQSNPITVVYQLASPQYEPINYNPFTVYSDITHISNNSTIPCNMTIKNTGYNCLLKPSTTYTVSSNLGLNTVTTPSVLTEDCLRFYDTDTSDVTTMKNVMVLEGDYTTNGKPLPSHFSGLESCFEQEYDEEKGKYKVKARVQNEDASKENYIEFYIDEPLRGIGDVKDKVYVKNDKVVVQRNCASVTLDGSESWKLWSTTTNTMMRFAINDLGKVEGRCLSDVFKEDRTQSGILNNGEGISLNGALAILLFKTKLQTQDVAGFKQWLQQNPTTVVYQLAEPTYEEVEYNDVKLFIESFKNSTLFYNSNIPVTSKLWYSYSIPLVDKVSQTANISDQQDSMIIDMATQVAVMEIMLM